MNWQRSLKCTIAHIVHRNATAMEEVECSYGQCLHESDSSDGKRNQA
jgi:hypothetical protein